MLKSPDVKVCTSSTASLNKIFLYSFLMKMESCLEEGQALTLCGTEGDSDSGIKFQRRKISLNNTCVQLYVLNSSTDLPRQLKGFFSCPLERSSSFHVHVGFMIWKLGFKFRE